MPVRGRAGSRLGAGEQAKPCRKSSTSINIYTKICSARELCTGSLARIFVCWRNFSGKIFFRKSSFFLKKSCMLNLPPLCCISKSVTSVFMFSFRLMFKDTFFSARPASFFIQMPLSWHIHNKCDVENRKRNEAVWCMNYKSLNTTKSGSVWHDTAWLECLTILVFVKSDYL